MSVPNVLLALLVIGFLGSLWYGGGLGTKDLVWFVVGWSAILAVVGGIAALVWWLVW